jgi:hypothetical protein
VLAPDCILSLLFGWLVWQHIISSLKMEMACFSETVASASKFTWHRNPKEHHQNCYCLMKRVVLELGWSQLVVDIIGTDVTVPQLAWWFYYYM